MRSAIYAIVAGVVAGVVTSVALRSKPAPPQAPTDTGPAPPPMPAQVFVPAGGGPAMNLGKLSARVHALEERSTGDASAPDQSEEDLHQQAEQQWQATLDAHKREGVDAPWAEKAAPALTRSLNANLPKSAQLVELECRTTTCSATIEWTSYKSAKDAARALVSAPLYEENCGETMHFTDAAGDGPYRTTMLLDCESVRTGAVSETIAHGGT